MSTLSEDRHAAPAVPVLPAVGSAWPDQVFVLLCGWLIGGIYLDGWAHSHRRIETFFTPWHLVLYSGFFAATLFLAGICAHNRRRGGAWQEAIPAGYGWSLVGAAIFLSGGTADLFWHQIFGFERGVEALVSPSHLILGLGVGLLISGPIRAAAKQPPAPGLLAQIPLLLSATFLLALLQFFTQYAAPFTNVWLVADKIDSDPRRSLVLMPVNGTGDLRVIPGRDADLGQAQWSPDGRQIVFVSGLLQKPETFEIWIMNANGEERTRLTNNSVYDGHPSWSPDGKRIVFESHQRGAESIYLINKDGTGLTRLSQTDAKDANPVFSPDGAMLGFDSDRDGSWQIYLANNDGSGLHKLTDAGQNRAPAWSSDGQRIAFSSDRDGPFQIYVMDADGKQQTRRHVSAQQEEFPVWAPDGRQLAFVAQHESSFDIMLLADRGMAAVNLTADTGQEDSQGAKVSWDPSGKSLLFGALGHARMAPGFRQAVGLSSILLHTVMLMGFVLLCIRWNIQSGGLALLIGIDLCLAVTQSRTPHPELLLLAPLAGCIAEGLRHWLRPQWPHTLRLRWFAFALPSVLFGLYFAAIDYSSGLAWSPPLWSGSILLAGTAGWLLSYVFVGMAPLPTGPTPNHGSAD